MRLSSITCVLALAALAGCPNREVSEVNPVQDKVEQKEIPLTINRDIDILFVIDDSGSMGEEQNTLLANFPVFIDVLSQIQGGLPNVHLGIASSDFGTLGVPTGDTPCSPATGGDQGNLRKGLPPGTGCTEVNGNFISDIDPDNAGPMPRMTNYSGTLNAAFSCMANLGTLGCGFEQHLASMKAALLGGAGGTFNGTFLRSTAYLAVIIVADEDDCSAENANFFSPESPQLGPLDSFRCFEKAIRCNEGRDIQLRDVGVKTGCGLDDTQNYLHDVSAYVSFLKGLKSDQRNVIVAGIIGPTEPVEVGRRIPQGQTVPRPDLVPSCSYCETGLNPCPMNDLSTADPGFRLRAFIESFIDRNTFTTICDNDYTDALNQIAELLRSVIGYPCLEGDLVDKDPSTPTVLDPDCSFAYVTNPGQLDEMQTVLPQCDAGTTVQPCWRLVVDAMNCGPCPACTPPRLGTPTQLSVEVVRMADPPVNTYIQGGCVVR